MWLENLIDARKRAGNPPYRVIAEAVGVTERTISRLFQGETDRPYVDIILDVAEFLGVSAAEIFADTKATIGTKNVVELQKGLEVVTAERDLITAENSILKDKVTVLSAENDLLKLRLEHKEEIIALHNYYNKLEQSSQK